MRMICVPRSKLTKLYLAVIILVGANSLAGYSIYSMIAHKKQVNSELLSVIANKEAVIKEKESELLKVKTKINHIEKVAGVIQRYNHRIPNEVALHIASREIKYSTQYKVPLHVGLAISAQESTFNPDAISYNSTSYGLKQVNRGVWAKNVSLTKLTNLDYNTNLGYRILKQYLDHSGSYTEALGKYYGSTNSKENKDYSNSVLNTANIFKAKLS